MGQDKHGLARFAHNAMAAPLEILVAGEDPEYAQQAAAAAFEEIDRIEQDLSRHRDTSDVARINQLSPNHPVRVGPHAFACLKAAAEIHADTAGVFDVTIGPLMACWRNPDRSLRRPSDEELAEARGRVGMHLVVLDDTAHTVAVKVEGVVVDLGGIGKGYAADCAARLLAEWEIGAAFISVGSSTVLALDPPPGKPGWAVGAGGIGDEPHTQTVHLRNRALSGSATRVKGRHIMDPRTGRPAAAAIATWALCPKATTADALSTAFMVMRPEEVERYCERHPDTAALLVLDAPGGPRRVRFGAL